MTHDEFIFWKNSPVTQEVFLTIRELIQDAKDDLAYNAGVDPVYDRKVVGKILGLETILDMKFESEGESE